jgi:hypothetical protein
MQLNPEPTLTLDQMETNLKRLENLSRNAIAPIANLLPFAPEEIGWSVNR